MDFAAVSVVVVVTSSLFQSVGSSFVEPFVDVVVAAAVEADNNNEECIKQYQLLFQQIVYLFINYWEYIFAYSIPAVAVADAAVAEFAEEGALMESG